MNENDFKSYVKDLLSTPHKKQGNNITLINVKTGEILRPFKSPT